MADGRELARTIGRRLKAAREDLRLSQAEAAERIGVTDEAYGSWERGVRLMPTNYVPELERAFQRPALWFLDLGDWAGLSDQELLLVQLFRGLGSRAMRELALEVLAAQQRADQALRPEIGGGHSAGPEGPEGPEPPPRRARRTRRSPS